VQLQQAYEAEILTRAEYERKRKALLATARTPLAPAAVNEARALALLTDVPTLMAAAKPSERRAVVGALFEKVWIQAKGIIAVTPRSDGGPLLAGLARVRYGCLDGAPDGHQCPAFRYVDGCADRLDRAPDRLSGRSGHIQHPFYCFSTRANQARISASWSSRK
jgi:hypothetical protein